MNKNKKTNVISGEEHYTNLMLIVVAEAMVLLITQMLIYNGFKSLYIQTTMNIIVPVILIVAAVVAVISAIMYFMKKKNALISLVFGGYVALLMLVIRFVPNSYSEALGSVYCNTLRSQKIGVILSVIYVIAGILYCILAEKRRRKLKK